MSTTNKTLSLKLPPEAVKVLPFVIAARKRGNSKEVAWAAHEYELAEERAREREQWERAAQDRRERIEWQQRLIEEEQEREYLAWLEEQRIQAERLERLNAHWALEDGWEEFQPTQSSQKGWRRMLSECADLQVANRYGQWGGKRDLFRSNQKSLYVIRSGKWKKQKGKHNNGRKPRKPCFK